LLRLLVRVDVEAEGLGGGVEVLGSTLGCAWSLASAGFGCAIALKTDNPAAVNSNSLLFSGSRS